MDFSTINLDALSPSTRRAWIEIIRWMVILAISRVALHPEGVDRNCSANVFVLSKAPVALHPEGVDRNDDPDAKLRRFAVALHPEGVDRNIAQNWRPRL